MLKNLFGGIAKFLDNVTTAGFWSLIITLGIFGILYILDSFTVRIKLNPYYNRKLRYVLIVAFFIIWYLLYKYFSYDPIENPDLV